MKIMCIMILFWPLSVLLSDESLTSQTVSFYNQGSENIFKGTLCVHLAKYPKAIKGSKKKSKVSKLTL